MGVGIGGGGNHGPRPRLPSQCGRCPPLTHIPSVLVLCPGRRDRLNLADERIMERFAVQLAGEPIAPGFDPADSSSTSRASGRPSTGSWDRATRRGTSPRCWPSASVCRGRAARRSCAATTSSSRAGSRPRPCPRPHRRSPPSTSTARLAAPLPYPFFLKPVTAHLSQLAYRIDGPCRLRRRAHRGARHDRCGDGVRPGSRGAHFRTLIAEELLDGVLVTFEGFMCGGRMTPVGVTDAVMHPNGISFLRFEYPSALRTRCRPGWPRSPPG